MLLGRAFLNKKEKCVGQQILFKLFKGRVIPPRGVASTFSFDTTTTLLYVSRKNNEKLLMHTTAGLLNGDHGTLGARVIMA